MDNATRKELLYKARAVGYPGSILDVFANYDQGRDLIAEFQQQQQMQQAQQMSNIAAQQSGLEQPQQQMQQPQQQMQPQMPVVPSSPTPAPNFTPPQPPAPIGVQSQNSPMGMVSGQSGPNQGRAIFATGGFTGTCKEGEYFDQWTQTCINIEKEAGELKTQFKPLNDYLMSQVTDPKTGKLIPVTDKTRIMTRSWSHYGTDSPKIKKLFSPEELVPDPNSNINNGVDTSLERIAEKVGTPRSALKSFNPYNPWNSERFTRDIQYPWGIAGQKDGKGKITTQEQEDARKLVWNKHKQNFEKLGFDPALIGYMSQDYKQPAGLMDPGSLVTGERYTMQPIISVGKPGEQVSWSKRKGEIMTKKNVADEEGQPRVVGATNMSGVDIPKKKKEKKLGGVKCYTCVGRKRRV